MSTNPLKDIMVAAKHSFSGDNRSYYIRSINNILKSGKVEIKVNEPGFVWRSQDGAKKWNVVIKAGGWVSRSYTKNISAFYLLRAIGEHLQLPQVKEKILAEVSLHKHCEKCGGSGFIPAFHYYCNGICFDCFGTGFSKFKDLVEINSLPVS